MDSWASFGKDSQGREVGYSVKASCDCLGCLREITRSLTCLCGEMHSPTLWGCGLYFCSKHRSQVSHKCVKIEVVEILLAEEVKIGQEMKTASKKRKKKAC